MMSSAPSIFLGHVFTRKFFAFAGDTLLAYDYLLTLSLEVSHIWNERWTTVKVLFLINRYGNLLGQMFIVVEEIGYLSHGSAQVSFQCVFLSNTSGSVVHQFCLGFQLYCSLFGVFSGESIRLFVVMRACAIMRCRKSITSLVNASYVLYAAVLFALTIYLFILHVDVAQFQYLDEVGICILPVIPRIWTFWFIPFFIDGFIFALVCYSLFRFTEGSRDISLPLIHLLVRDALLFYLASLFYDLSGIVCWSIYYEDPRNIIHTLIACPILSVTGQRLILNLRRFQARTHSTSYLSQAVNRQLAAMVDLVELDRLNVQQANSTETDSVGD